MNDVNWRPKQPSLGSWLESLVLQRISVCGVYIYIPSLTQRMQKILRIQGNGRLGISA